LKSAKDTLAQADGLYEVAERVARGECGHIKVGLTIAALFFRPVQQAIRAFQQQYPDILLELAQISSRSGLEALWQRKLDVCVVRPFPTPLPPDLRRHHARSRPADAGRSGGTSAGRRRKDPAQRDCQREIHLIALQERQRGLRSNRQSLGEVRIEAARRARSANGPGGHGVGASGLGVAILPSSLQAIRFEHVVWKAIDVDDRWTEISLDLVYHKDISPSEFPPSSSNVCVASRVPPS
jgi:DNA-binding transcriptional LysR family regulator